MVAFRIALVDYIVLGLLDGHGKSWASLSCPKSTLGAPLNIELAMLHFLMTFYAALGVEYAYDGLLCF